MKICLDGLSISQLNGTGLYSYSYGLLSNLLEMYPQAKYELIWDNETDCGLWEKYGNLAYIKIGLNRKDNDYKLLEDHIINSKVDLYHSPNNGLSIPQNKVCKYIITVHDLSPVSCSKFADEKYSRKFNALFPVALEKADCIIAVSEFIKAELMKFYNIPDKKIEVINPWCSDDFKVIDMESARTILKTGYNIEGKFILYAGSIHLRKNLDVLIKAFQLLLKQMKDLCLVIVGSFDTKRKEYFLYLKSLIQDLGIEKQVIFTGSVPYADMPYFYNCTSCTVNLSSYDGFPTTAIEAKCCNSTVLALRSSSFEEVLGQSTLFLDNLDIDVLKNKLINILDTKTDRTALKNKYTREDGIIKLVRIYESTVYGL